MSQLPDVIEQKIIAVLDDIAGLDRVEGGMSSRRWTELIKEGLCRIGKDRCYGVSAAGCAGADSGEWLFDLVWAGGEQGLFQSLELVVECEWSTDKDQLLWDFEKLLIAKSIHKLFVYQGNSDTDVHAIAHLLISKVRAFKCALPGERYMLAGWVGQQKKFIHGVVSCDQLGT